MKTLLLDVQTWDLVADASGNIAVADDPYAPAQDVASITRLVLGELWYDTTKGIDYFNLVLGKAPSLVLLKNAYNKAALSVPGVVSSTTFIASFQQRVLQGQIQITDPTGKVTPVAIRQVIPS